MFFVVDSGSAVIFVIGGSKSNRTQRQSVSTSGVVSYIPDTSRVPVSYVYGAAAVVDRTRITLSGGLTNVNGSNRYDLVWHLQTTDLKPQWSRGPDLLTDRINHVSFRLGTKLFVGMGNTKGTNGLSSLEMLDTTHSSPVWQQSFTGYPLTVTQAACVVMRNQGKDTVWVAGGTKYSGSSSSIYGIKSVYSWQGPGYRWKLQTSLLAARYGHSLATDGVHIWVVGGYDYGKRRAVNIVDMYSQGTWTKVSPLPVVRSLGGSVYWNDSLIQIAGYGPAPPGELGGVGAQDSVFVMNVTSGNWSFSDTILTEPVSQCAVAFITP